ncbi:hypothetical protein Tco_1031662, partial [Tanacetum coccineum]
SLSGWSGQGYKACPTCNKDTLYVRVLGKTTYVGHRRFLKKPHKWRRSLEFNGETKDGDPLREFDRDQIQAQLSRLPTCLKSHDCHITMQRLLPYGLQQYLPDTSKVVDILCNLELIYPLAFFDIMIHLVIYLPLEALEGGPIRPYWMYPFKRFTKKLKNYVRNKAKPKGSIAEGYVAEEALTFSSHYFRDVTTKFNRPDRNVDPLPPTCQFQVFRSVCKLIGLWSVIRFDDQELKKVICLNDLDFVTLHIDGQLTDVDAPPDIIDVDKDDDIIDDENALLHDLANSNDENLVNVDDDDDVDGVADALPFLAPGPGRAEGGGPGKDWDWDAQIAFWNDPKNLARCAQNRKNRAKSTVEEMLRLQGLGSNTETGVPYTEDEIMAIVRKGKQRGHLPGVGRVLPGQGTDLLSPLPPPPRCTHNSDVVKLKKSNKLLTKQVNIIMKLFRSDDKMSQMLTQLQSQPKFGSGSGSGPCGDDEPGDDDSGEDEEDADS